jgi:hypothetical protein
MSEMEGTNAYDSIMVKTESGLWKPLSQVRLASTLKHNIKMLHDALRRVNDENERLYHLLELHAGKKVEGG